MLLSEHLYREAPWVAETETSDSAIAPVKLLVKSESKHQAVSSTVSGRHSSI